MEDSSTKNFDWQGHRGCRGLMPENTIPAMLHAIELGVHTLEMDVVITRDKQVILSHEPFFNHEISTKPDGTNVTVAEEKLLNVYAMSYAEVSEYDVGVKPHPRFTKQQKMPASKPLLIAVIDSVLADCKMKRITVPYFNIETKTTIETDGIYHPLPGEFVEVLMGIINAKNLQDKVIIQSFDMRTLQYLHANFPKQKTALLIEGNDKHSVKEQIESLGFKPTIYSPEYGIVTKELVTFCHSINIKVIPWTVNSTKEILALKALGVDGIITDYPNLIIR